MDLVLRNLTYKSNGQNITIDIGINRTEINREKSDSFYMVGRVKDFGDLSVFSGYQDLDLKGCQIVKGKTFPEHLTSAKQLEDLNFKDLYSNGFTNVIADFPIDKNYTKLPVNIITDFWKDQQSVRVDEPANFCILKEDKVEYVVVNGFLIKMDEPLPETINGEVIR